MSRVTRRTLARVKEERVVVLLTQGRSQREIAAEVGMSPTGVRKALRRVEARVIAEMNTTVQAAKVRGLLKAEELYRQAFTEWTKSKAERSTRTRRTVTGATGRTRDLAEVKTEDGIGDPRFLAEARAALALERTILGLDQPTKVEHVHTGERPAAHLTDAEIDAKLAEIAKQRIH